MNNYRMSERVLHFGKRYLDPESSKTDQDTDQETWILISLNYNSKYSIFPA